MYEVGSDERRQAIGGNKAVGSNRGAVTVRVEDRVEGTCSEARVGDEARPVLPRTGKTPRHGSRLAPLAGMASAV